MSLSELLGEPELNPFQKAFYSGDFAEVKKLCQEFKPSKDNVLFAIIDEILVGKKHMEVNEIADYDQNMINLALSQYADLIYYAEAMNSFIGSDRKEFISNQMHYDYLINSIRQGRRPRVKWAKSHTEDDELIIACISELTGLSKEKSAEYVTSFSEHEINQIKKHSKAFAESDEFLHRKFNITKARAQEFKRIVSNW